ncbi:DeoR/GlpR family DNA-binding transcription regulator [Thermoflexus sp.]|uniref:DeoR/GlpR family DNA-binding transcription regulator n=1 Tax=Thermoflexus sp. TaxID=1969742 RepID=UPI0035E44D58
MSLKDLFAEERQRRIAELVRTQGRVVVAELAERFGVSEATIRRDLTILEQMGVLQRTHGGAILAEPMGLELQLEERATRHLEEKIRIGQKAAELIADGDTVILDAGTTTIHIAKAIKARRSLTVVTNALNIAMELMGSPGIEVIFIGGSLRPRTAAAVGPFAEQMLSQLNADKVFLATNGISLERGLTTPNPIEARTKQAMIAASRQVITVADHSKFGKVYFAQIASLQSIDVLITDDGAEPEVIQQIEAIGIHVFLV